jgi:hypothetical protein
MDGDGGTTSCAVTAFGSCWSGIGKYGRQEQEAAISGNKKSFWETIITEARSWPEGMQYFLDRKNISKNNYYYWFHRLRQEHPKWKDLPKHKERSNQSYTKLY